MATATKKTPPADIPAAQMNGIMRYCTLLQDIKIIMHQVITPERIRAVREFTEELDRRNQNAMNTRKPLPAPAGLYEYDLFMYGYISGIRAERKRRRGGSMKNGFEVVGHIQRNGQEIPLLDFPMMDDYKWQLESLNDRMEHPEKYEDTEDVQATIAMLRNWLADHGVKEATV